MSAGYLWRAAFEAPTANREALGSRGTAVVLFGDRAPRYTTPARSAGEHRRATRGEHATHSHAARRLPLRTLRSSAPREEATRIEPRPDSVGGRPRRPKPSPTATGGTSRPGSPAPSAPSAPAPSPAASPTAATAPPASAPAATPPPSAPTPAPAAVATPTPGPPRADEASAGTRPGWGNGDPNHTHTGPPGKSG
jgi:hypothetical protein